MFIVAILFSSCGEGNIFPTSAGPAREGWIGVYINPDSSQVLRHGTRVDANAFFSKTYLRSLDSIDYIVMGQYRYQLDSLRGIIVFDTLLPSWSRDYESYFRVSGIRSLRKSSGSIIVDNFEDEVVLSVDEAPQLRVVERRPNVAPAFLYPEQKPEQAYVDDFFNTDRGRYFECYDSSKGLLIGWIHQESSSTTIECFLLPE